MKLYFIFLLFFFLQNNHTYPDSQPGNYMSMSTHLMTACFYQLRVNDVFVQLVMICNKFDLSSNTELSTDRY